MAFSYQKLLPARDKVIERIGLHPSAAYFEVIEINALECCSFNIEGYCPGIKTHHDRKHAYYLGGHDVAKVIPLTRIVRQLRCFTVEIDVLLHIRHNNSFEV